MAAIAYRRTRGAKAYSCHALQPLYVEGGEEAGWACPTTLDLDPEEGTYSNCLK